MRITERAPLLPIVVITLCAHMTVLAQEPSNITLPTTTLTPGRYAYQASNSITANSFTIPTSANVTFQAGSTITLNPGFSALTGSSFNAYVNPVYIPGTTMSGHATANSAEVIPFNNIAPPGVQSVAGGDIYLQAFDNNGNLLRQCPISFLASPGLIVMTDNGQQLSLPGSGSITNGTGECTVSAQGTTITPGSTNVSLAMNMTFSAAAVGTYVVTADTFDTTGDLSPLEYLGTVAVAQGSPTITMTAFPLPVVAPFNQATSFSVTITGLNGFTNSDTVTLTPVGPWPGSPGFPSSVTLSSDNNGNPSQTIMVPFTATSNPVPLGADFYYEVNAYNSKSGTIGLWVELQVPTSSTVTQTITSTPVGLIVTADGEPCTTPCTAQWVAGSQHILAAASQTAANGTPYVFTNWWDGETLSPRGITVPSTSTTYTANFATQVTMSDPKDYIYLKGRVIAIDDVP